MKILSNALLVLLATLASILITPTDGFGNASPPPAARPIIVGTSDFCNVLFGKLQRAAALWGTNLGEPRTVLCPGDKQAKLKSCLWNQFYMASPGSEGTISEKDLVSPLSSWLGNDMKGSILFVDAATPKEKTLLDNIPFMNNKKDDNPIPTLPMDILKCAYERECAHVYVLASSDTVEDCYSTLDSCSQSLPSTILVLEKGASLQPTPKWTTSRLPNMEGEFVGPIALSPFNSEAYYDSPAMAGAIIPAEDAVEVMIQLALRTDRDFRDFPRIVQLGPADNANWISWEYFLSPLGQVNSELGKRPDQ